MTDEKSTGFQFSTIVIGLTFIVMLLLPFLLFISIGDTVNDYNSLDNSPCQNIIINDTFLQTRGYYGASTYYYIVTNESKIYELFVGSNTTKMYKWKTIVKGQEYSLQIYDEYVEFCGDRVLGIDK